MMVCRVIASVLLLLLFPAVIATWIMTLSVRTHYGEFMFFSIGPMALDKKKTRR